ncbi:MAG: DUF6569 family protein [Gemmatimonadota bacterium]|nr:DUF6569 family protein [Gemmatimonadota bacterium]
MTQVASLQIAPAPSQRHGELTIFPLVSLESVELPYRLLEDAISDGSVEIGEVDEAGSVPELLATNLGAEAVLLLDGEQLLGAKQNRMASRSLLLPGETATRIPVSCIEHGRWRYTHRGFRPSDKHSPSRTRKSVRSLEARLAKQGIAAEPRELQAAQADVWDDVASYSRRLGVRSRTGALDELYDVVGPKLEGWVPRFPPVEGQVGLVAFDRDRLLGSDVVGGRGLYARLHGRLLRGYMLDALELREVRARSGEDAPEAEGVAMPDESRVLRFLAEVAKAERTETPTAGGGIYRVLSGAVVGGELVDEDRLAHRSAFAADPRE